MKIEAKKLRKELAVFKKLDVFIDGYKRVKLIASDNQLIIYSTDLECTISKTLELKNDDVFSVLVRLDDLLDVLSVDEIVELNKIGNEFSVKVLNNYFIIDTINDEDYPKITEMMTDTNEIGTLNFELNKQFLTQLDVVKKYVATDDVRKVLMGLCIDLNNNAIVGTNGKVMGIIESDKPLYDFDYNEDKIISTNLKIVDLIKSMSTEIFISVHHKFTKVVDFNTTVICRNIEGLYPNYCNVIPKVQSDVATVNMKRLKSLSTIEEKRAKRRDTEAFVMVQEIDCQINSTFLKPLFSICKESMICEYTTEASPCTFKNGYLSVVIMPLQSKLKK